MACLADKCVIKKLNKGNKKLSKGSRTKHLGFTKTIYQTLGYSFVSKQQSSPKAAKWLTKHHKVLTIVYLSLSLCLRLALSL